MRSLPSLDDIVRWMGLKQMTWEQAVDWLRERPGQDATVRANYFDLPVQSAAERFRSSEEFAEVARLFGPPPPDGRALDFGAGNGIASFALASEGWRVDAVEPDPSARVGAGAIRALARQTTLPIEVTTQGELPLPFEDGTFDVIFGRQVMHHVPDLDGTARELRRVLKPGGRMLDTREHVADNWLQKMRFFRSHGLNRLYHGENAFPLSRYVGAFRSAGLRVVQIWGPLASILNFYPGTEAQRVAAVAEVARRSHLRLGRFFTEDEDFTRRALERATRRDRTPGRSFSFLLERDERRPGRNAGSRTTTC
jgi:SAM-dependent methyltransferase